MSEEKRGSSLRWRRLLLEVAAIFLGITASFLVDDWREERQDTETFRRILGEVYYDIIRDESLMTGAAASNNQGLLSAADLTLDDGPGSSPRMELPEDPRALFGALDDVFRPYELSPLLGGYTRLSNTALAIPVNDIQLALDDLYGQLLDFDEAYDRLGSELSELRTRHWDSRGGIPCVSPDSVEDNFSERLQQALDTRGQMAPVREAIHRGDDCLSKSINERIAIDAMGEESFRTALRTAIRIRREMASILAWQRGFAMTIRWQLEAYLPGITLPIDTLGIAGSATPADWDPERAIPMRRNGPHEWTLQISLGEGEVKFLANREWTMNWGAPRPWVASSQGYAPGQISLDDAFPSGRAWFNGLNIPVRPGRYQVSFNTQSGEYDFKVLED